MLKKVKRMNEGLMNRLKENLSNIEASLMSDKKRFCSSYGSIPAAFESHNAHQIDSVSLSSYSSSNSLSPEKALEPHLNKIPTGSYKVEEKS